MSPDPFSDQMAADHRRDYEAHRLFDDLQRTIREVLASEEACARLCAGERATLLTTQQMLERRAAHIVAVYD